MKEGSKMKNIIINLTINVEEKNKNTYTTIDTSTIAQRFFIGKSRSLAMKLNKLLESLGIQHRQDKDWILAAEYKNKNYKQLKSIIKNGHKIKDYNVWTKEGEQFIVNLMIRKNFVLLEEAKNNEEKQSISQLNLQLLENILNPIN